MFGRNGGDVLAVEHDAAPIGVFKTGDQAQHRGFATAGGAENGEEFAVVNRQFEIGNDGFAIERFAQGMQFNKGAREDVSVIYRITLSRGLMQIEPQLERLPELAECPLIK